MMHRMYHTYWRDLEADAERPEVQELIRREICRGTIRVRPKPGGGIRILPVGMPEGGGLSDVGLPTAPLTARMRRSWKLAVSRRRLPCMPRARPRCGWFVLHLRGNRRSPRGFGSGPLAVHQSGTRTCTLAGRQEPIRQPRVVDSTLWQATQ
jgi:hypothetical protein